MTVTLSPDVRALFDGRNFATLATINPDGSPQTSVLWVLRDGDTLLFSVLDHRKKARNVARDPRVSVAVHDEGNPYVGAEVRGTAELLPDPEKALPGALSQKYLEVEPPGESDDEVRLIIRVTPTVVHYSALG
ncbi:PPOX class F420-dependent oxidoreductase [Cryptosporangium phraense]|uniref:PPOX class F420-dependent oxidoreductase n=1 Tax=Cryptosporangium phraense TaxID=2593070 RepID=UPI0014781068|nr:PPOX class F420-dependent oxidoreductase [Cryptosporangium phraense]